MAKEKLSKWPNGWNEDLKSWLVELGDKENKELLKTLEVPQNLKDFREAWEERINNIYNASKEKIIKAVENIPVKVETESDGSRLIEFKLWNTTYKILDPRLENYTDDNYGSSPDYDSITHINHDYVRLWWMMWDDVENWENKKLKEYVKEKQWEWLHIAKIEEMKAILAGLGEKAELDSEEDQIAMLMYLSWMDWWYRLSMWNDEMSGSQDSRSFLTCGDVRRDFYYGLGSDYASLCMIACQ